MTTQGLYPDNPVLIVDDEPAARRSFAAALHLHGITNIAECGDSREVMPLLTRQAVDAMLLDLTMPFVSGEDILKQVCADYPAIPVIVVTATDDVATAVRCLKLGASDYVVKPAEKMQLVASVKRALEIKALRDETQHLRKQLLAGPRNQSDVFSNIITGNAAMQAVFHYLESITTSRQPLLVTGETGVGKELIVKAWHQLVAPQSPLIAVNVAGLDDTVFSDTLFGHRKGAFTGATANRLGLVETAAGGILHLDEIGDLSLTAQLKLLRLLQENEYLPLGSDTVRIADIRIVATTNQNPDALEASGRLRRDLYYRLSAHHIRIPPLRQRPDDIPRLLNHFIARTAARLNCPPPEYEAALPAALQRHPFPGNVRELEFMVEDAMRRNRSPRLTVKQFQTAMDRHRPSQPSGADMDHWLDCELTHDLNCVSGSPPPTLQEAVRRLVKKVFEYCGYNQSEAARLLGISRARVARILKGGKGVK